METAVMVTDVTEMIKRVIRVRTEMRDRGLSGDPVPLITACILEDICEQLTQINGGLAGRLTDIRKELSCIASR